MQPLSRHPTSEALRRLVLAVLVLALVGIGVELLLLEHTEGFWQLLPVGLIAAALVELVGFGLSGRSAFLRLFQATMVLFVIAGPLGVYQHYSGNAEFELEMVPAMLGLELFKESMTGATPVLAPGTMLQLGLLGLAFTFRHPVLSRAGTSTTSTNG
jgi:hypothetical protein